MRLYVLRFASSTTLQGAFGLILESGRVTSCSAEPELCRLRFKAPVKAADSLVERIYQVGGLTWCSRHDLS